jgi:hypothetical protein
MTGRKGTNLLERRGARGRQKKLGATLDCLTAAFGVSVTAIRVLQKLFFAVLPSSASCTFTHSLSKTYQGKVFVYLRDLRNFILV